MHPPIPSKRPVDNALEAVKYDTIKTLWRVPYRSAPAEHIRKAMQDFWEIVSTIRDRWKSDLIAVKQAEDAKKIKEVPMLKDRVASQRGMLQACLKAAVAEGHKDILEQYVPLSSFMLFAACSCISPVLAPARGGQSACCETTAW